MKLPTIVEVRGMRVLTTRQISEMHEVSKDKIIYNFNYNKLKFILGKHYIEVSGEELRRLKTTCENQMSFKYAKSLYFWTEKGTLLHAKSLNTDKAWEVYDYLVDFYFRAKETAEPDKRDVSSKKKRVSRKVDVPENHKILDAIQKIRKDITCMDVLLEECSKATWESAYNERSRAAADLLGVIAADYVILFDLEPNVLEEKYY